VGRLRLKGKTDLFHEFRREIFRLFRIFRKAGIDVRDGIKDRDYNKLFGLSLDDLDELKRCVDRLEFLSGVLKHGEKRSLGRIYGYGIADKKLWSYLSEAIKTVIETKINQERTRARMVV
jgi:hypothetical protein